MEKTFQIFPHSVVSGSLEIVNENDSSVERSRRFCGKYRLAPVQYLYSQVSFFVTS